MTGPERWGSPLMLSSLKNRFNIIHGRMANTTLKSGKQLERWTFPRRTVCSTVKKMRDIKKVMARCGATCIHARLRAEQRGIVYSNHPA